MKAWMVTKRRTVVKPKVKRKASKVCKFQNQIVRAVKGLNQQLTGSPQKG